MWLHFVELSSWSLRQTFSAEYDTVTAMMMMMPIDDEWWYGRRRTSNQQIILANWKSNIQCCPTFFTPRATEFVFCIYLGSYIGSTSKDIEARIGLIWSILAKFKPILTSPKPTVKFKTCLFKAACASNLLYACEAWVPTQALATTMDTFARKCYWIMLGICQAETHMTNTELYCMAHKHPISEMISEMIRERQLQFTGHCLRMSNYEPANIYIIYQNKIRRSNLRENSGLTYLHQISKYLSTDKTVRF